MESTLILSIVAMSLGFFGIALKMCFASKCTSVECLCLKVHRNVDIEATTYEDNEVRPFNALETGNTRATKRGNSPNTS